RHPVAVGARFLARSVAPPHQHLHAERLAVAGDDGAYASVAEDPQGLAAQRVADAGLPLTRLERFHLQRDVAHGGDDHAPGELGGRVRRHAEGLVRAQQHAEPRARVDVDVRKHAALADEPQLRQPLEERRADLGALADQDQGLRVLETLRERLGVLHVVVPHLDLVAGKLLERLEGAQGVVVVVEDVDFHAAHSLVFARTSGLTTLMGAPAAYATIWSKTSANWISYSSRVT